MRHERRVIMAENVVQTSGETDDQQRFGSTSRILSWDAVHQHRESEPPKAWIFPDLDAVHWNRSAHAPPLARDAAEFVVMAE